MALPYPIPDPATGQWDPFAIKRDFEYLDARFGSFVSNPAFQTVIFRSTGAPIIDVVSTGVETTVYTTTITEDVFESNRTLLVTVQGDFKNNSGVDRATTIRIKYGGTTFATFDWAVVASSATRRGFGVDVSITATSTTTQYSWGEGLLGGPGVSGSSSSLAGQRYSTHNAGAIVATSPQTLSVTVQNDVNDPNVSTRVFWVIGRLF